MSRVKHKLVKQRLNEKRSQISDRQFFSSRILAGHFEEMAAAQTRRYHYNRRVRVNLHWNPKSHEVASTDDLTVRINTGNSIVTKVKGRENRYQIVCGLFAHELGHILYTDFLMSQTYNNALKSLRWYPYTPIFKTKADIHNERSFWGYAKADPKNLLMIQYLAHQIANIIEDGYIEDMMLRNFPGTLGYGLEQLREQHLQLMPTVTELIEKEDDGEKHIFESILQLMLSYAKFGEIKYGDEPMSDERIQTVFGLISVIDDALMSGSAKDRLNAVNVIMIRCWNYIEDFLEICKKRQEEAEASGETPSVAETISQTLQSIEGTSNIGTGNSKPVASSESNNSSQSATSAQRAQTHADAGVDESNNSTIEPSKDDSELSQTETESTDNSSESGEQEIDGNEFEGLPTDGSIESSKKQEVSATETGRIPYQQTEECSEPIGGTTEMNAEYERHNCERAASDIERILDQMAEKEACKELENERLRELNDVAQNISYGNIHAGVNIRVNRINDVDTDLIDQYAVVADPLETISRQLQRSLVKQLQDSRRGGKQTGLIMGRRLDAHSLCRNDGKVFYKNNLPNEIPELAVGLLLDESGSMSSSDRCTYARAAAIILYDFCQSLDIPVMIYGHSTGYHNSGAVVELYSYAEFDSIDQNDRYRLMDISARGSNRDGAALRFVAEQLSKRPEDVKMLILVSDGQPAHTGYYGSAAEEDLRGIKQEYQRKGILFVAAAIGDDKVNIERIYGDAFLDITDLNQLPIKLTNVVKRHIRV